MIRFNKNLFIGLVLFVSMITFLGNHIFYLYSLKKDINIGNFISNVASTELKPTEIKDEKQSVYFLGDLMLARDVERRLKQNGIDYAFANINFSENNNTYVVANFEGTIPGVHKSTPNFGFQFSVDESFLPFLSRAGITHVSLANNHALDFGQSAYLNSFNKLTVNNIVPFGHPIEISSTSISYLEIKNHKIALIGLMAIDTFISKDDLMSVFDEAKSFSDLQIVVVHWGSEYLQNQSDFQRRQAKIFSELGADLVVGHHPHVVQGIEWINNTLVFYSLGNFLFDQYFSKEVQEGLVLNIDFKDQIIVNLLPVSSLENRVQPSYMSLENKGFFLKELANLSQTDLQNEILNGSIMFKQNLATSTEVVIMTQ